MSANATAPTRDGQLSLFRQHLFSRLPMYTTRLVREADFTFTEREQVCAPQDVAALMQEYFRDKDREEFLIALLDPVMWD